MILTITDATHRILEAFLIVFFSVVLVLSAVCINVPRAPHGVPPVPRVIVIPLIVVAYSQMPPERVWWDGRLILDSQHDCMDSHFTYQLDSSLWISERCKEDER